jgi:hypothetical protein
VSNGEQWACLVPSRVKRRARDLLTARHGGRNLQYRILALLVYLAVRDRLHQIERITIDRDFTGQQPEATIKSLLLVHVRRDRPDAGASLIDFAEVKGSRADNLARAVFLGKVQASRVVTVREVEAVLGK